MEAGGWLRRTSSVAVADSFNVKPIVAPSRNPSPVGLIVVNSRPSPANGSPPFEALNESAASDARFPPWPAAVATATVATKAQQAAGTARGNVRRIVSDL